MIIFSFDRVYTTWEYVNNVNLFLNYVTIFTFKKYKLYAYESSHNFSLSDFAQDLVC